MIRPRYFGTAQSRSVVSIAIFVCAIPAILLSVCAGCGDSQQEPQLRPRPQLGPPAFKMVEVESSMMTAIGYDPQTKKLRIRFIQGQVREYEDVAPEIYQGLLSAESHGKYYHAHIRDRYQSTRVK